MEEIPENPEIKDMDPEKPNENDQSIFKKLFSGIKFFGAKKDGESDKMSDVEEVKLNVNKIPNSARASRQSVSVDKRGYMKSHLSKNAFTHGSQLGATKIPAKKGKKGAKNPKFRKYVDGTGYHFKTGVKMKNLLDDFLLGDIVFEFDYVDSYSRSGNTHMVLFKSLLRVFDSFVNNQTYNLDFSM